MHYYHLVSFFIWRLAPSVGATPVAASGNSVGSAGFVDQLDLQPSAQSRLSSVLHGIDVDHLAALGPQIRASIACQVVQIALSTEFVSQNASTYQEVVEVNWSSSCWLEPQCIAQPQSTKDVSRLMRIVTFFGTKFAVRSGGHNPNPGWAGVNSDGILIDMSKLTAVRLSRDGLYGLAADNVINYEVVLANASVINANASSHPDLWWALKGTNTNFGVVTRYDLATVDNHKYWFEAREYAPARAEALLDAVVQYATAAEKDHNAAILFSLTPTSGFVEFVYHQPTPRPAVYNMFYDIPSEAAPINSTLGTMADLNNANSALYPDTHARRMIASVAHKFDLTTLKDIYAMYLDFDSGIQNIKGATSIVVQPFTSAAVQHSKSTGGNPVGLIDTLQNHLTYTLQWTDSKDDPTALAAIRGFTDRVEALLKKRGLFLRTKIPNDAGDAQAVLASFGPENLGRLRGVSARYDPSGVFQHLQNNGFLLSKA
ncbi:FAD-binding domain-containing protein [Apiospora sp. TS-2023a]